MFVTKEILEKYNACQSGTKWFERHFPDGGELIDVIKHPKVDRETLHWGFTTLPTTEEEKTAYRAKLKIDCGDDNYSIYGSDNVLKSKYVTYSSNVRDSEFVFHSKEIENSTSILHSDTVENSNRIYGSSFIYDSEKIINSKNVTESNNIINSDYVLNSHHIYCASGIKNSAYIADIGFAETRHVSDSYFISGGKHLDHCLFCFGIENQSYQLFNQPIDEIEYKMIIRQMESILRDWEPELVKENYWPEKTIPIDTPTLQRHAGKQWASLPDRFWQWVKTLPGYDSGIMYSLTFQSDKV